MASDTIHKLSGLIRVNQNNIFSIKKIIFIKS